MRHSPVLTAIPAMPAITVGAALAAIAVIAAIGCAPSTETSVIRLTERADRSVIVRSPLPAMESSDADPGADARLRYPPETWRSGDDIDDLGLVRRGRLLPTPRVGRTKPPFDSTYEIHDALFAPTPSHLRFGLEVPEDGRLTFSYALAAGSRVEDAATFEVQVGHGGEPVTAFIDTLEADDGLYWRRATVDLTRWSRSRIELHLITSSPRSQGLGLALWGSPIVDGPRRPSEPPNVLLIGIDTLRADRLSSYGYRRTTTPHIDDLAADGVRFDNAISAANWTAPSFTSIFTGLPPGRHAVGTEPRRWRPARSDEATSALGPLTTSALTLTEIFRDGGWRTEAVAYKPALFDLGLDQGFDRWFNMPTSRRTGQENLDRALAWLTENHDRRFFMFLHLNDPHQPFNQPAAYEHPFGEREARDRLGFRLPVLISKGEVRGCDACAPEGKVERDFMTAARDLYDGEVAYVDHLVGSLVTALKEWGIYDDTVVALLSDHGEVLYDRNGHYGHGGAWLTDDLVRVPMILKPHAEAGLPTGLVVDGQVRTTDLLPTLVELAGLEPPVATADSRTLVQTIRGRGAESRPAFSESPRRNSVSLRTGRWKYVVRVRPGQALHELYDLEADPAEQRDVAADHVDEMAQLDEMVVPYFLRTRPGPFLLVLGDGSPGDFKLTVESSRPETEVSHVLGVPPAMGDPARTPGWPVRGRVISFIELDLEPDASVAARLLSGDRLLAGRTATRDRTLSSGEGTFASLLELEAPNVYFLRGAEELSSTAAPKPANLDQIEELRALGYID